ncbi:MAG: Hpt domain-containing protein [Acidobacteriaceae bacterium]
MTQSEQDSLQAIVNLPELLARVDYDWELLQEIVDLFMAELPRLHEQLSAAVSQADLSQVEKLAHTLKGMLLNLSIEGGAEAVAAMEQQAKAEDVIAVREEFKVFESTIDRLRPSLDAYMAEGRL